MDADNRRLVVEPSGEKEEGELRAPHMATPTPAISKEYSERKRPYVFLTAKLVIGALLVLLAFGLFTASTKSHDPDEASASGWLMAPLVWVLISAYRTWKAVPRVDRDSADLRKLRFITAIAFIVLLGTLVFTSSSVAIRWELKQAQSKRIGAILAEGKSLGPTNIKFRARLSEILQRDIRGYADFQAQCADLETALDDAEPTLSKARNLLDHLDEEYIGYPDAQSFVALFKQLTEQDAKLFSYLREEINCSKTLGQMNRSQQARFSELSVAPARERMSPVLEQEQRLLKDAQQKGATIPPDLVEALR